MNALSPQTLLALAAVLFLVGCVYGAFRPDRWLLALVPIIPSVILTVWLVFGEELRALFPILR